MKKILLLGLMLTAVLTLQAQLTVAPKLSKGIQKHYQTTTVIEIPGQGTVNINTHFTISVVDALPDGFVLNSQTTQVTTTIGADNIAGQLMGASSEIMKGATLKVATDKSGKPLRITNMADVRAKLEANSNTIVERLLQSVPQLGQLVDRDAIKKQIMENATEAKLLNVLLWTANPLALNGKTITTGAQEDYVDEQDFKMRRMYFVNGQTITTNATMNMTRDELKSLIIKKIEKLAPAQLDMVKQNIDQVIDSGMLKFDSKDTSTYELQADGWVKSIKSESTIDTMGQQTKMTSSTTLK